MPTPTIPALTTVHSKSDIEDLLALYPSIRAAKLEQLDETRYTTLPQTVAERKAGGLAYLTKQETLQLLEWKLKHGAFRPSLQKLVESNSEEGIRTATVNAFSRDIKTQENVKTALGDLTALKGIGPATASLLLSVCYPDKVPFFSDELFRWALWEEGSGNGWDRKIKYSIKEYLELFEEVRTKEALKAVELEKAAYVAGKLGAAFGSADGGSRSVKTKDASTTERDTEKSDVKDKKRKVGDTEDAKASVSKKKRAASKPAKEAVPGTRTSARTRSKA